MINCHRVKSKKMYKYIQIYFHTSGFKSCKIFFYFLDFIYVFSYAHKGWTYLIKNTLKAVIFWKLFWIYLLFKAVKNNTLLDNIPKIRSILQSISCRDILRTCNLFFFCCCHPRLACFNLFWWLFAHSVRIQSLIQLNAPFDFFHLPENY